MKRRDHRIWVTVTDDDNPDWELEVECDLHMLFDMVGTKMQWEGWDVSPLMSLRRSVIELIQLEVDRMIGAEELPREWFIYDNDELTPKYRGHHGYI